MEGGWCAWGSRLKTGSGRRWNHAPAGSPRRAKADSAAPHAGSPFLWDSHLGLRQTPHTSSHARGFCTGRQREQKNTEVHEGSRIRQDKNADKLWQLFPIA